MRYQARVARKWWNSTSRERQRTTSDFYTEMIFIIRRENTIWSGCRTTVDGDIRSNTYRHRINDSADEVQKNCSPPFSTIYHSWSSECSSNNVYKRRPITSQMCSIGGRSGEYAGYLYTLQHTSADASSVWSRIILLRSEHWKTLKVHIHISLGCCCTLNKN